MNAGLQIATPPPPQAHAPSKGALAAIAPLHEVREDFTVYQPAGFRLRWYALTLDLALSTPLDVLVHLPFNRYVERMEAYGYDGRHLALSLLLWAIPMTLYFVAPTVIWGQTLGKRIVGLRVVRASFNPNLSFGTVLLRETLGKALSLAIFGIGFLLVAFDERKRGLHDRLAKTQVVSYRLR